MAAKGAPKTGGRKKGSKNKRQRTNVVRAAKSGLLPHEFLLAVSRGEVFGNHTPTFEERLDAAAKAAPYFAGKLSNVTLHGANEDGSLTFNVNLVGADARA